MPKVRRSYDEHIEVGLTFLLWLARLFSARASATILAVASALARPGNLGRLAAGLLGLAAAVGTFVIAEGPGAFTTYAGVSGSTAVLSALTGTSLIVAGLVTSFNDRQVGPVTLPCSPV